MECLTNRHTSILGLAARIAACQVRVACTSDKLFQ